MSKKKIELTECDDSGTDIFKQVNAMAPPPPSPLKVAAECLKDCLKAPFRIASGIAAWIVWHVYGKYQYNARVQNGIERWKVLAGVSPHKKESTLDVPGDLLERAKKSGVHSDSNHDSPSDPNGSIAQAIHDDIIKTRIIKVELPLPDVEDGISKNSV